MNQSELIGISTKVLEELKTFQVGYPNWLLDFSRKRLEAATSGRSAIQYLNIPCFCCFISKKDSTVSILVLYEKWITKVLHFDDILIVKNVIQL